MVTLLPATDWLNRRQQNFVIPLLVVVMNLRLFRFFRVVLVRLKTGLGGPLFGLRVSRSLLPVHLQVQAKLDRELSRRQARRVATLLANAPEARLLFERLERVKSILADNEPQRPVPQSRELYWSNIERAIAREEKQLTPKQVSHLQWGWRLLPACSVLLAICALLLLKTRHQAGDVQPPCEVEVASADMGAVTYQDERAGLTVVWHYERANPAGDSLLAEEQDPGIDME